MYRLQLVRLSVQFLLLATICTALGCGGGHKEFSAEDFKTVTKDMPEAKVFEILGKPKTEKEAMGTKRLFWEAKSGFYSISFKDGKVIEPMAHPNKDDYDAMMQLMDLAKSMKR